MCSSDLQQLQHSKPAMLFVVERIKRKDYRELWARLLPELPTGGPFADFPSLRRVVQLQGGGIAGAEPLERWLAAGVTRVSVGVQALADERLRALDRLHDVEAARATLAELARLLEAGQLRSANADLIYGGPGQDVALARADVEAVLGYGLPHLSAYEIGRAHV